MCTSIARHHARRNTTFGCTLAYETKTNVWLLPYSQVENEGDTTACEISLTAEEVSVVVSGHHKIMLFYIS